MTSILNRALLAFAVLATAAMPAGAAFAGEGNGDPFPLLQVPALVANPVASDAGSQAYPTFASAPLATVTAGGTLPANGSQGPVQTANSLPSGFETGTVAYAQAQSVRRYLAQQEPRGQAHRTAQLPGAGTRG